MRFRSVLVVGVVAALALVGCSDDGGKKASNAEATTTTPKPPPVSPLTGLPDPSGASQGRCALTVKIENDPPARPQSGLNEADVVYDEVIDGGITRLVAIYNSQVPETVGPVRSVRPIDPKLVYPIGGVFAYSGGVPENVAAIKAVPNIKAIDENDREALFRTKDRQPPRNLYGKPDVLFQRCPKPQAPQALFQYRGAKDPAPVGDPVQTVNVQVSPDKGFAVDYAWNGTGFARSMSGKPFADRAGKQVVATNAIVMFLQWDGAVGSFNAEGITIGTGDAWIFTNGVAIKGKWNRPALEKPATFTDSAGKPVLLTPGTTWVELPPVGQAVTITPTPTTTTAAVPAPAAPTTAKR